MGRAEEREFEPWIEAELAACPGRIVFVDGFNVLHAAILTGRRGRDWWTAASREPLLERVSGWPDAEDLVWVVFDGTDQGWSVRIPRRGPPSQALAPRVHVTFAASADDWIVRRARRASEPGRIVVVSADRQVAGRARGAGCEVLAPRAFASLCGASGARPQDDFVAAARAAAASPKTSS